MDYLAENNRAPSRRLDDQRFSGLVAGNP